MGEEIIEKYIRLTLIPGFGVISQNRLLMLCGDIEACFAMASEELRNSFHTTEGVRKTEEKRLESFLCMREDIGNKDTACRILESCREKGIDVITSRDARYPARFKTLPDMPILLYAKGTLKINEYSSTVGIIGARRCSREGKEKAILKAEREMIQGAAIISGMAKGIDAYAQTAAIKNGGYTIAVLGNGADICYPKEHERLYEEIIANGCVLSEYPPGTVPKAYMFPRRNRLIAGLSDILYVIDAGRNSGTHTTIDCCRKYGRAVIEY
ncbi:MAG: DNA-processing protein DprA [Lachnospiraceae bacterium]